MILMIIPAIGIMRAVFEEVGRTLVRAYHDAHMSEEERYKDLLPTHVIFEMMERGV